MELSVPFLLETNKYSKTIRSLIMTDVTVRLDITRVHTRDSTLNSDRPYGYKLETQYSEPNRYPWHRTFKLNYLN